MAALSQSSKLLHWPVSKHSLTVDEAFVHRAKIAAIVRHRAMVAKHEETIGRNYHFAIRPGVCVVTRNVVFVERLAVHKDLAVLDTYVVAGGPNNALDVALRSVARIP